jgi:hypothetical protein
MAKKDPVGSNNENRLYQCMLDEPAVFQTPDELLHRGYQSSSTRAACELVRGEYLPSDILRRVKEATEQVNCLVCLSIF